MKVHAFALTCIALVVSACATHVAEKQIRSVEATLPAESNSTQTPSPKALIATVDDVEKQNRDERLLPDKSEQEKNAQLKIIEKTLGQNNAAAALVQLDAYDQKWGVSAESTRLRADYLLKTNQLDQAETLYLKLIGKIDSGPIWYGLGKVSIERGDLQAASIRLEKAVQVDPQYIEAYTDLGLVYLLQGEKIPAHDTLMKASELSNSNTNALANLALWALVYDNYTMAMDIADRLKWSESTRKKLMAQATTIQKRIQSKGARQ